jgi:hypothetical protein
MMQDPAMLKTAAEMMKTMPPEQLKAAMAQAGQHLPPGMDIDPQQLSQMAETVAKMPPEQVCMFGSAHIPGSARRELQVLVRTREPCVF